MEVKTSTNKQHEYYVLHILFVFVVIK